MDNRLGCGMSGCQLRSVHMDASGGQAAMERRCRAASRKLNSSCTGGRRTHQRKEQPREPTRTGHATGLPLGSSDEPADGRRVVS